MDLRWRLAETNDRDVAGLVDALALPEPLARVLTARGLGDPASAEHFLRNSLADLTGPFELAGMTEAADRLAAAVTGGERILVHGDFDADGITATALLTLFLRGLGADVLPFVPNRLIEGHGISHRAVAAARDAGVKLLVTCDCGSSSRGEIESLRGIGIDTVVTDHHVVERGGTFPAILVNPKGSEVSTGCDDLSGVGVAFMLATALRARLRERGWFGSRPEPNLRDYLDVVALGTIADLAPLVGQNRILVAKGLEVLAGSARPGIRAMRESAGMNDAAEIGSHDVGFRLAPRINAAARLGHSEAALDLLLASEDRLASELAAKMEAWNGERKSLQERMTRVAAIEAERQLKEGEAVLFAASEEFHPGVIGLVAQKLAEIYESPAFVFALEGETARGSARSRCHLDLMAPLSACRDLLASFGGHREACGCTMAREKLPEFRRRFRAAARQGRLAASQELWIDAPLNFRQLNESFLSAFRRLRPFGVGNPEPVFLAKGRVVGEAREMGRDHVRVTLRDEEGPAFGAVGFGMWRRTGALLKGQVEVAYTPEENDWNGRRELRLRLRGVRPA